MKRTTTLTASLDWISGSGSGEGSRVLAMIVSMLKGLLYNALGFGVLIGFWYLISRITNYELPTPD